LKLPNEQCQLDPLPTWLLKECVGEQAPFLSHLISLSLQQLQGVVPASFKSAFICPLRLKQEAQLMLTTGSTPLIAVSRARAISDGTLT